MKHNASDDDLSINEIRYVILLKCMCANHAFGLHYRCSYTFVPRYRTNENDGNRLFLNESEFKLLRDMEIEKLIIGEIILGKKGGSLADILVTFTSTIKGEKQCRLFETRNGGASISKITPDGDNEWIEKS